MSTASCSTVGAQLQKAFANTGTGQAADQFKKTLIGIGRHVSTPQGRRLVSQMDLDSETNKPFKTF